MNVKDIVIEKLKAIGADGLCNIDCGCPIDDLMFCDYGWMSTCKLSIHDCVPAKKLLATTPGLQRFSLNNDDYVYVPMELK